MEIGGEEIGVYSLDVKVNMPDRMGCVDKREDAFAFANIDEALPWDEDARHAAYYVEDGDARSLASVSALPDQVSELLYHSLVRERVVHFGLERCDGRHLAQ